MTTRSHFLCFAVLAAAVLASGSRVPWCAEGKAALAAQGKKPALAKEPPVKDANDAGRRADALFKQGRHADAEKIYRAQLELREKAEGAESPNALLSRYNIALCLMNLGKLKDALPFAQRAEAGWVKALGPEHAYSQAAKESRERIEFALKPAPAAEKELTAEEQKLMKEAESADKRARDFFVKNNLAESEREFRAAQEIRGRVLGAEHPDTLASRSNLTGVLDVQGNHAEAEKEYREILSIMGRVLGPDHMDTIRSRYNLALSLRRQGKRAEAEKELRAFIPIQERELGPSHPETLKARTFLAVEMDAQGRHAEAEMEFRALIPVEERELGAKHPELLEGLYRLALCLEAQEKFKEALPYSQRAEAGRVKALGREHRESKEAREARERIETESKKRRAGKK